MSTIKPLSSDEKIVTVIACIIGVASFSFFQKSCSSFKTKGLQNTPISSTSVAEQEIEAPVVAEALESKTSTSNKSYSAPVNQEKAAYNPRQNFQTFETPQTAVKTTESEIAESIAISQSFVEKAKITTTEPDLVKVIEKPIIPQAPSIPKAEHDQQISALANEIQKLKETIAGHSQEKLQLTQQSQKIDLLTKNLTRLQTQNQSLSQKIEQKKKEAEAKISVPERTEPQPKAAFANSAKDLRMQSQHLFKKLEEIDPLQGEALEKAYRDIKDEFNSTSQGKINFASGQFSVSESGAQKISEIASKSSNKSHFLIVGFADQSGSAAGNKNLSSKRAQSVMQELSQHIPSERIQSIYLGQTSRFGSREKNRVVEIWELLQSQ